MFYNIIDKEYPENEEVSKLENEVYKYLKIVEYYDVDDVNDEEDKWVYDERWDRYLHKDYPFLIKQIRNNKIEYKDRRRAIFKQIGTVNLLPLTIADQVINEMKPIEFPYRPEIMPYIVYSNDCFYDENNCLVYSIPYILAPRGELIKWNRYYQENKSGTSVYNCINENKYIWLKEHVEPLLQNNKKDYPIEEDETVMDVFKTLTPKQKDAMQAIIDYFIEMEED